MTPGKTVSRHSARSARSAGKEPSEDQDSSDNANNNAARKIFRSNSDVVDGKGPTHQMNTTKNKSARNAESSNPLEGAKTNGHAHQGEEQFVPFQRRATEPHSRRQSSTSVKRSSVCSLQHRSSTTTKQERPRPMSKRDRTSSMYASFADDNSNHRRRLSSQSKIFDTPKVVAAYDSVPIIECDRLPRGGISLNTQAVGRIQFGIPPETIKDSMKLGLEVPSVYIVPMERFCREMGPALGVNLAEFEFPAYFNYFVRQKQCTLVVDSVDAEQNIRKVFDETLLGPAQFRSRMNPVCNEDEDFSPTYPKEARPNFYNEFNWFRKNEATDKYDELQLDMLLKFCHFRKNGVGGLGYQDRLGVPPIFCFVKESPGFDTNYHSDDEAVERRKSSVRFGSATQSSSIKCKGSKDDNFTNLETFSEDETTFRRSRSNPNFASALDDSNHGDCDKSSKGIPKSGGSGSSVRSMRFNSAGSVTPSLGFPDWSDDEDEERTTWTYSQAKWLGEVAVCYPHNVTEEKKKSNSVARVEIFKMPGGSDYVIHDVDENNHIIGKACISGTVHVPESIAVVGFPIVDDVMDDEDEEDQAGMNPDAVDEDASMNTDGIVEFDSECFPSTVPSTVAPPNFHPPSFGVTVLGNAHGFDKSGSTSGYVLWVNGRGVMVDPPPYSSATLEREGIRPNTIIAIIVTHCHADHDAGTFQKVLFGSKVAIITTPTIYKSFIRKYAALCALSPALLMHCHRFRPAIIGQPLHFQGATFHFSYTLHTIPCIAFRVEWRGKSIVFTGDHLNNPTVIDDLQGKGILTRERADSLRNLHLQETDVLLHESGAPPIHTPLQVLQELPQKIKDRLYVVHTSALPDDCELRVAPTGTAGTIRLDSACVAQSQVQCKRSEEETIKTEPCKSTSTVSTVTECKLTKRTSRSSEESSIASCGGCSRDKSKPYTSGCSSCGASFVGSKKSPLVALRPTCVSDAWFMLNLLAAVPFFSSLAFTLTMEVLEIAKVELYSKDEVVLPAEKRRHFLCVVWEGTLIERVRLTNDRNDRISFLSEDSSLAATDSNDETAVWYAGDWTGPISLQPNRKLSSESTHRSAVSDIIATSSAGAKVIAIALSDLHVILLKNGSGIYRKALLDKKQRALHHAFDDEEKSHEYHLTCTDEIRLTKKNLLALHTRSSFVELLSCNSALRKLSALQKSRLESIAEPQRRLKSGEPIWVVDSPVETAYLVLRGTARFASNRQSSLIGSRQRWSSQASLDFETSQTVDQVKPTSEASISGSERRDKQLLHISRTSEYGRLEASLKRRAEQIEAKGAERDNENRLWSMFRGRFANKVLMRLYSRRAFTTGIIFSRGSFLCDVSKIMSGSVIAGNEGDVHTECHSSTIIAGEGGCDVIAIPKERLLSFLDENPGVLLSLLGTQAIL
mmetsp:Transcript_12823/g.19428  ORF Transcript_12823/g.19428 Transcript_12823/m.19428 type:complete len:1413 (-) Transcript_12823:37-4275(-)